MQSNEKKKRPLKSRRGNQYSRFSLPTRRCPDPGKKVSDDYVASIPFSQSALPILCLNFHIKMKKETLGK